MEILVDDDVLESDDVVAPFADPWDVDASAAEGANREGDAVNLSTLEAQYLPIPWRVLERNSIFGTLAAATPRFCRALECMEIDTDAGGAWRV